MRKNYRDSYILRKLKKQIKIPRSREQNKVAVSRTTKRIMKKIDTLMKVMNSKPKASSSS